ncbi:hypothetical protein [Bradyrhizobium sp. Tv2a-2]|nr:hypothetical protein [Bradyrhizobium sp. Tv2a-2]
MSMSSRPHLVLSVVGAGWQKIKGKRLVVPSAPARFAAATSANN